MEKVKWLETTEEVIERGAGGDGEDKIARKSNQRRSS